MVYSVCELYEHSHSKGFIIYGIEYTVNNFSFKYYNIYNISMDAFF